MDYLNPAQVSILTAIVAILAYGSYRKQLPPTPTIKLALCVTVGLFAINGVGRVLPNVPQQEPTYVQTAFLVASFFGAALKGALCAAVIWLGAWGGCKLRLKKRHPIAVWIGAIAHWIGCVPALSFFGFSIYVLGFAILTSDVSEGTIGVILLMLNFAFFFWFVGGGIHYMLSAKPEQAHKPTPAVPIEPY